MTKNKILRAIPLILLFLTSLLLLVGCGETKITEIVIEGNDKRIEVIEGDKLNLEDLSFYGVFESGLRETINPKDIIVTGFNSNIEFTSNEPVLQQVTLTYKAISIKLDVYIVPKQISTITIFSGEAKTRYLIGEIFSINDILMYIAYKDGSNTSKPLTKNNIINYDVLPLDDDGKLTSSGNFQLEIRHLGVEASNTLNIIVEKHAQEAEEIQVLSNTTLIDPTKVYDINTLPNLSQIEITPLLNGAYKIIKTSEYTTDNVRNLPYQDTPVFTNLEINQEYIIIAHQKETDFYKAGKTYEIFVKTNPLATPEPEIVSFGYNFIEIRKVNNYINYVVDYSYRLEDLGDTIKLTNLEPNVNYEITARYVFPADKEEVIESKVYKTLLMVDNPFTYVENQVVTYNNEYFNFALELKDEFKNSGDIVTKVTYNKSIDKPINVGVYAVEVTHRFSPNPLKVGTIQIVPRPVNITINNLTKDYYDNDPVFTISTNSVLAKNHNLNNAFTVNLSRIAGEAPGEYKISGNITNPNYSITITTGTLTINKKKIQVEVNPIEKTFGSPLPTPTYRFLNGEPMFYPNHNSIFIDNLTFKDPTIETNLLYQSGYYPDQIIFTIENPYYQVEVINKGSITIKKLAIDLMINSSTKRYGENDPVFTYTLSNENFRDAANIVLTRQAGQNVGEYTINLSNSYSSPNFIVNVVQNNKLTITPRKITYRVNNVSITYGQTDYVSKLSYTLTSGSLVYGDTIREFAVIHSQLTNLTVGTYQLVSSITNPNYDVTVVSGTLTVSKKDLVITPNPNQQKTYGEDDPIFRYELSGLIEGDNPNIILTRQDGENQGTYSFSLDLTDSNPNYNYILKSESFKINPKQVEVIPITVTKVYLENDPVINYTVEGLVNENDLTKATGALYRAAGSDVGEYEIFINNLNIPNYTLIIRNKTFTITPKPITINYNLNESYTYGDYVDLNKATSTLKSGDYIVLSGYNRNVGVYTITPTVKNYLHQDVTHNYSFNNPNTIVTINKADLLISPTVTSKVYGNEDPMFQYTILSGLKYNDTNSVVSGCLTRTEGANVGSYEFITTTLMADNYNIVLESNVFTITPKEVQVSYRTSYTYNTEIIPIEVLSPELVGNLTYTTTPSEIINAGNYSVSFTSTNPNYVINNINNPAITIKKKLIKLNVLDAIKAKGANNPDFLLDETPIEAFRDEIDFSNLLITTTATLDSTYGTYPIIVTQGLIAANYQFTYTPGTLTIKHADFTLDITEEYVYNGLAQELEVRVINNDNIDVTDQFTVIINYANGTVPVNAGTYEVDVIIRDSGGDIPFEVQPQVISPLPITINYNIPTNYYYGDPYSPNQATAEGLIGGHRIELVGSIAGVGIKTITSKVLGADNSDLTSNYEINNGSYAFEVKKAILTVTPNLDSRNKVYGNQDPELSFNLDGFKNGETSEDVSGSLTREAGEITGTYNFLVAELVADHYSFVLSSEFNKFTINKRESTVDYKLADSYTYGDVIQFTPTATNLLPGHTITLYGYDKDKGPKTITPIIKDNNGVDVTNNYEFTNPNKPIVINPAVLEIVPVNNNVVYGSSSQTIEFNVLGYKYDDNNLVSGKLAREEGVIVGSYPITINTLESISDNYVLSLGTYTYNIVPKEIDISFDNSVYTYNKKVLEVSLLSDGLAYGDIITITNNTFVDAGTYNLTIKIMSTGNLDVSSSYVVDELDLVYVISPREITSVEWLYNNELATATSTDLLAGDTFTYQNNDSLVPGPHTATLSVNSNYIINNQELISHEYVHFGTINENVLPQEVAYDKNAHQYDVTILENMGYIVEELVSPEGIEAQNYPVKLRLSKEHYYPKVVDTLLIVKPKDIEAEYLYNSSYVFTNTNYLNDLLVVLPTELTTSDYNVKTYKYIDNVKTEVHEIVRTGEYVVEIEVTNTNYQVPNNVFEILVTPANLNIIIDNELLFEDDSHSTPTYEINFDLELNINYHYDDNESSTINGITEGVRVVGISTITVSGIDYTNEFTYEPVTTNYTVVAKDYIKLMDYNKDDLSRTEDNMFANGLMEATKNPQIGFGYRYHNVYFSNKFVNGVLNSEFATFNSLYYYKFGTQNTAKIYIDGLVNFDNINFDNVVILGQGVTLIGVTNVDLTGSQIHSSARVLKPALEVQFSVTGPQTITIAYQKYDKTLAIAKLNVEVIEGFTNITKYEELFNGSQTVQNIILNNGIAYLQTLGITIKVNAGNTLYGNNYEINSYSAAYADTKQVDGVGKPQASGVPLVETWGTIDNVRIIQRKTTSYAQTTPKQEQSQNNINSDVSVVFQGGVIKNSFVAYGRETVEIRSTTADLLIVNSTILSGPFGIRRRTSGKLTLNNVKVISSTDKDFLLKIEQDANNPAVPENHKFKVNGVGMPIVFLKNEGFAIKKLEIENITLEIDDNTKIYSFHTMDTFKGATLPSGVSTVVVGDDSNVGILEELWIENQAALVYRRNKENPEPGEEPFDSVLSPAVLLVSLEDIRYSLDVTNPVLNFADSYKYAYKDIGLASGYGYVYTYNLIDEVEGENGMEPKYPASYIAEHDLFNPPNYIDFTGEYEE